MENTTKKCPMCAETIQAEAKVCRFCGARFEIKVTGYCANCHEMREADANGRCAKCGSELMDTHIESALIPRVAPTAPLRPTQPAPPPQKSRAGLALLSCFVVLLILAGGGFALFYFTGGAELMMPVEEVTFDTIGQYEKERRVKIEGLLHLPSSTRCDDNCGLQLVDYADSDKVLAIFVDVGSQNGVPEPNHMIRLPAIYGRDSLKVGLTNGGVAGNGASVILTGRVCETTSGKLCLHVDLIEQGSIPPTPTPTRTPIPTATPLPVNVDFSNVCSHIGAPVIVQGRIRSLPMFMFCSRTCSLSLADLGGSGKILYFDIARGGSANQMENLPSKYKNSDLRIHTNDGQIVGVDDVVIIHGVVGEYSSESDTTLDCKLTVERIEKAP